MTLSTEQLNHLCALAYLNPKPELGQDLNEIILFMAHLRQIDTANIQPLTHPMDSIQPFRPDEAQPCDHAESLSQIAPLFKNNLYLVPRVITS